MTDDEALRDGYFDLRRTSQGLRAVSHHFEGQVWHRTGKMLVRHSPDGNWTLRVYRIEGGIEACVIQPDGQSMTFS